MLSDDLPMSSDCRMTHPSLGVLRTGGANQDTTYAFSKKYHKNTAK